MKLAIAIPALNEEDSITSIVERSLAAREKIVAGTSVKEVEVIVVSDGSTDRTVERARAFGERIKLVVFEKNRGYGAAIQEAWRQSDAELVGFLDADGTCDPEFFVVLCNRLLEEEADVSLGCRLNKASKMPPIRRLGNVLFALLLSLFSNQRVRDTASGMRVVRRSSLPRLLPLPTGMHFTPAMSARAILSEDLKILESDMPYHEREGRSKLSVIRDGLRFLRVIVEAAFLYRPSRPLVLLGVAFGAAGAVLMVMPAVYYLRHHALQEWMIYRFVVSSLAATSACLLVCTGYLAKKVVTIVISDRPESPVPRGVLGWFFGGWPWVAVAGLFVAGGALLVAPSFFELVRTGATYEHWSRFIAMSTLVACALTLAVTRVVDYTLDLIAARLAYFKSLAGGSG